jgi:hypothetical protein
VLHNKVITFFPYIGKSFTDTDDDLHFQITKIVVQCNSHLKHPKLFFRYFDTEKFVSTPLLESDYEHTPCSEFVKKRRNTGTLYSPTFIVWDTVDSSAGNAQIFFAPELPSSPDILTDNTLGASSSCCAPYDTTYRTLGKIFLQLAVENDNHSAPILPHADIFSTTSSDLPVSTADCSPALSVNSTFHSSIDSSILNLTSDGKQLTYRGVMRGDDRDLWSIASGNELIKLIVDTKTLVPIHRHDQPADQRQFTTYYNPQVKEKLDEHCGKIQRVRGTYGGNKKSAYDGPTSSPVADIS